MFNFFKPNVEKLKAERNTQGLAEALKHKDSAIRQASIDALGEMGDELAIEFLVNAIEDRVYEPLAELIRAINEITDRIGAGPFLKAAQYAMCAQNLSFLRLLKKIETKIP